jgi:hypothetical protein
MNTGLFRYGFTKGGYERHIEQQKRKYLRGITAMIVGANSEPHRLYSSTWTHERARA